MHLSTKDFLTALLIGAEMFAIASLWPLSEWAASEPRRRGLAIALAVILACVVLCTLGLAPPLVRPGSWRWLIGRSLGWSPLLLFMGLPAAVCVASAQSLAGVGVRALVARRTALCVGLLAVLVAPLATLAAGCGLTGACF